MSPDLRFELLAITSIVSFLVMGGTLGLWAATSRWHWFARAMVVVCLLALVQWRPLYELYLTLLTQVAVIAVGVALYRRKLWRWRFSVAGLLKVMVVAAVVLASLMREPGEWFEWTEGVKSVGFGLVGGTLVLVGTWLAVSEWRWRWRFAVGIVSVGVLGVGWYLCDTLLSLFVDYHGMVELLSPRSGAIVSSNVLHLLLAWISALTLAVTVLLLTFLKRRSTWAVLLSGVVLSLFPGYLIYRLSSPLPVPAPQAPSAAYIELMSLAEAVLFVEVRKQEALDVVDNEAMAAAVASAEPTYTRLAQLLTQEVNPGVDVLRQDIDHLQQHREIAQRLWWRGEVNRLAGKEKEVARTCRWMWDYCANLDQPGMLSDAFTLAAIEQVAADLTYKAIPELSREDSLSLSWQIADRNQRRSDWKAIIYHERVYSENVFGWQIHWLRMVEHWSGADGVSFGYADGSSQRRQAAIASLLIVELALRAYHVDHGQYPDQLANLIPDYLPEAPVDPWSPSSEPLVYRKTAEGYVLYSRDVDTVDDGGGEDDYSLANEFAK